MNGKKVKDSTVTLTMIMQPHHANPMGIVHGGALMKEIDNAAGTVAVKHSRQICVTASIDRIDFHNPIYIGNLVTIKASINFAGRSSMEIGVRAEAEDLLTGEVRHIASAYLTFVAIGEDGKGIEVPPLISETDEDKRRNMEAKARRAARKELKQREKACQEDPQQCRFVSTDS